MSVPIRDVDAVIDSLEHVLSVTTRSLQDSIASLPPPMIASLVQEMRWQATRMQYSDPRSDDETKYFATLIERYTEAAAVLSDLPQADRRAASQAVATIETLHRYLINRRNREGSIRESGVSRAYMED